MDVPRPRQRLRTHGRMPQRPPYSRIAASRPHGRLQAAARLLRAPLLLAAGLLVGLFALAMWGGAVTTPAGWGLALGGWLGLWQSRWLDGRADLRWLLPVAGAASGLAAARIPGLSALGGAAALLAAVAAVRGAVRLRHLAQDWDDPASLALTFVGLVAVAAPLAWVAGHVARQPAPFATAWAALALGALAGGACSLAMAATGAEDPFEQDPRRATALLAVLLLAGTAALVLWMPRLAPLLAAGVLLAAAAGRPRVIGVLGVLLAGGAALLADLRPRLLADAFGGWPATASLALLAALVAAAALAAWLVQQRDRVRARLRAASGHLLTLAEKSPGLIATVDRDLRHRFANEAYRRWSGLGRDALEGAPLAAVLGEGVVAGLRSPLASAMAGAPQQLQLHLADGRELELWLEPYFGVDGSIAGVHLLADDVTWRGQSERDMRALLAAAPEPTLLLDEGGRIELPNDAALALFGASTAELVGTPLTAWLSEGPASAHPGGDPGMRGRRRDGTTFPVELHLGSLPGEHGGRSVVSLRDLSAQRALEAAARDAREQAQATLDSISDALVVCDPEGTITGLNPAAVELTGWTREEALGRPLEDVIQLVEPSRGVPHASVLRGVLKTGRPTRLEGERELVRRDGSHRPIEESASPLRDGAGMPIGGVLMIHDVSHVREQAQALSHMAQHDFLTGLPNRVLFQDRLTQALATIPRGGKGAVLYMDLDKFKPINDTLGHPVGDRVLQEVATRLRACVREDDTVSRQGGDEFVLLLQRLADPRDAARVAEKLIRSIEEPILVDGQELRVSASVGISLFPQDARDARALTKLADTALYHVKETGRGRYSYFTELMGERAEARMRTEHDLRIALMHEDFVLDYQPVLDVASGRTGAVEALLRWRHGDGTILLPEVFLPVAEETGLIVQIDEWVLHRACRQNAAWQHDGLPPCPVSVNVSLARFDAERLLAQVGDALAQSALEPRWLELEFRGDQLFAQGDRGRRLVEDLRRLGVRVAVDDIGSGQASIVQLADYGLDALKLDLAIVGALPDDPRARRIAEAICGMGVALGYPVVAKGVESEAHRDLLVDWGCTGLQGALFSPPVAPALLPGLLGGDRRTPARQAGAGGRA